MGEQDLDASGQPASSDEQGPEDVVLEIVPEPRRVGRPIVAWAIILGLIALVALAPREEGAAQPEGLGILEFQGKILVGAANVFGAGAGDLLGEAQVLNAGPVLHRLCFVVLAGEIGGPEAALEEIEALRDRIQAQNIEPSETESRLLEALTTVYRDYADERLSAPSLGEEAREELRTELHWFGRLALAPQEGPDAAERAAVMEPARRTLFVVLGAAVGALFLLVCGLVGTGIFAGLLLTRLLRSRIQVGSRFGGVYAETFAWWLGLFLLSGLAAEVLFGERMGLLPHVLVFAVSVLALAWPRVRGIRWDEFRREIGWTGGRRIVTEMGCGLACYISALPWVAASLIVTLQLMQWEGPAGGSDDFRPGGVPTHPILEWVAASGWGGRAVVFFLACVAAPVVEETMFRGVLYRHLREVSGGWRVGISVLFSTLVTSFLFAALHPQGVFGIPVLMTLAAAFCLAREWRGSLIGPMSAHALNNGVMTLLLFQAL